MEAVETTEVIETAEVLRPGKSPLRTLESSRPKRCAVLVQAFEFSITSMF